ncbi:hypothetical protein ACJMK2_013591, partial [Sinanodonta woodiana]
RMPKKTTSDVDVSVIKSLKGKMSPVDVATKYHIGYNRIYQIWKSPGSVNDKVDDKADDDDDLAEFEKKYFKR